MNRYPMLLLLAVAGCANTPKPATDAFAVEAGYTVAAHTEVAVAPFLSPTDLARMKSLDGTAYDALTPLRGAATISPTETQTQAASAALVALTDFLNTHHGAGN